MGLFDTVKCEYLLPNPLHQDLEFQTKDLDCLLNHYTITSDGRLVRHSRPTRTGPERDVEWPIHGDVRIYGSYPENERRLVEYAVRFTHGRVEWVRCVDERRGRVAEEPPVGAPAPVARQGLTPAAWGRRLTVEEFAANTPEKLELIHGEIPGGDKLLLLLLANLGLRRAAMLVGPEYWNMALAPLPDEEPTET